MSAVFGGNGDSGLLGLGEERVNDPHAIDKAAYTDRTKLEEDRQRMLAEYEASKNRQAPTVARPADVAAASLGPAQGVTAPRVGAVGAGPSTSVGGVAGPRAATIGTAQQDQFRQGQSVLAGQLAEQAAGRGPSVAAQQAQTSLRQSLANQVAATSSQRPTGTAAATQRSLANQAAVAEASAVGQAANARVAEQVAAREQLGATLSTGRAADIDVARSQAALQQEAAMKGTDVALQRSLSQADISSREGLARFQAERDRATQQATLDFEAGKITAEQLNQFQLQQAQLNQQASLANQQTNAQMSLADQEAYLKMQGMNDAQVQAMLMASAQTTQQQYNDAMAYEQMVAEQKASYEQMRLGTENASADRRSGMITSIAGMFAGGAAAASDSRVKSGIKKVDASSVFSLDPDENEAQRQKMVAGMSSKSFEQHNDEVEAKVKENQQKAAKQIALAAMSPGYTKTNISPIDASNFVSSNANKMLGGGAQPLAASAFTAKSVAPSSYMAPPPAPTPTIPKPAPPVMVDPGRAATPDEVFTYSGTATGGGFGGGRVSKASDTVIRGQAAIDPTWEPGPTQPSTEPAPRIPRPLANIAVQPPKPTQGARDWLGRQLPSLGELAGGAGVGGSQGSSNYSSNPNAWRQAGGYAGLPEPSLGEMAGMAGMSDPKSKQDVNSGDDDVEGFLNALKAYEYEYKPEYVDKPGAAPGRHVSVMADDLEKTPMGKQAVQEGPDGIKRVDYARLFGPMLAAQASLNERLHAVETKSGKKKGGK